MRKTLRYGIKVFMLYYKANGAFAIVDVINRLYESVFYPLIQTILFAKLLDILTLKHHVSFSSISSLLIFYVLATTWKYMLRILAIIRGPGYEFALNDYIELQLDQKLNSLDPAVFESTKFQNLLAQMNGVKGAMLSYLDRTVGVFSNFVQVITASIVISTKFPLFIPIILLSIVPLFISMNKYRDTMWPFWSLERGILERLFSYIRTTFSNPSTSKEVAIFKNGPDLIKKVKTTQASYYKRFSKAYNKTLFINLVSGLIQVGAFVLTQAFNLTSVFAGKLTIGQFTLYFQQTFNLAFSAEGLLDNYSSMHMRTKYIDQYFELLEYPPAITQSEQPKLLPLKPHPPVIEFKDVAFSYPGTKRKVLSKFNLTIKSGEKIALVGENGAGKSTLIKLLLRFYDVSEGNVFINGVDIKEVDVSKWHSHIGALFQDFIKYQFTFRENVVFGDLGKRDDMKLLKNAIRKSGADQYLPELPKGIDQIVGKTFEDGVDLSGGQWQKLALARAFFRDAPILILDEPTSAIDAKAEYEIFERVQKLQKDKTVIIISHRFSTVRNADRILVLNNGRIIEEGAHKTLMKKNGLYAELFNIQAQGYK